MDNRWLPLPLLRNTLMRLVLCFFLLVLSVSLHADDLTSRLRILLPGQDAPTVNERQFLHQRFKRLFAEMEADKIGRKSTRKKISRIAAHLRRDLLRTHHAGAGLADAFRRGHFNDATAAVCTALALEHFEISFDAYVDHWSCYLVVDPDKRRTRLYAPGHQKQKAEKKASFRREYLDLVRATVADDSTGFTAAAAEQLFERYYYSPAKKLSFGQLSAFLLYRRAQAAYRDKDFEASVILLDAAMKKEERPAFLVLRKAAEIQLKAIEQPDVEGDILTLFAQWSELPDNKYLPAAILQHFDEKQRLFLAEDRLGEAAELLGIYLDQAPAGMTSWAADMRDLQQYRLLSHHFLSGRNDLARRLAESLFERQPDDEEIRFILGELVIDGLRRNRLKGAEFTKAVGAAAERYPFIRKQDRFVDLFLRELAWSVRDAYAEDKRYAGENALARFRSTLLDVAIDEQRSLWTLTAFIAASNYHFRQKEYQLARDYVAEGLRYNANDQYLLHRRELLTKY